MLYEVITLFGTNGDVLQIRITRRKPAGGGHRLIEAGMNPAGFRMHQFRQGVGVGPLELGQRAMFENPRGNSYNFV